MKARKLKFTAAAATVAAVVGGGAAIAANQLSPTAESDAVVADAAKQLGVSAAKLDAALTKALQNRVDEAVAAGRLTQAQGKELKARLAAGGVPLVGLGPGGGMHRGQHGLVDLGAAAAYLGIGEDALRTRLHDGDTLAEIAKAEGKTSAGLVAALVTAAKTDLNAQVAAGRLTETQKASILEDLQSRIEGVVAGEAPLGFRGGHGPGRGGARGAGA